MSETKPNPCLSLYVFVQFCDCIQVTLTQVRGQIVKERGASRSSLVCYTDLSPYWGCWDSSGLPPNVPFQLLNMLEHLLYLRHTADLQSTCPHSLHNVGSH